MDTPLKPGSQSHRTDLVNSDDENKLYLTSEIKKSQSHRTDLVNSDGCAITYLDEIAAKRSRNPTVLIWSIPTAYKAGEIFLNAGRSRNPTVLIWSIPTLALVSVVPMASADIASQSHRTDLVNSDCHSRKL